MPHALYQHACFGSHSGRWFVNMDHEIPVSLLIITTVDSSINLRARVDVEHAFDETHVCPAQQQLKETVKYTTL